MASSKRDLVLLCAILLLALALRSFRLDGQSLWSDEGVSVALAQRDIATIARDAAHDIHPPLYYYLLHLWVRLFGTSEMAVRSLSVLCGLLLVLFTYRLGIALFDDRVALVASFLAAISPFQIYYSQETRMYILLALQGAMSLFLFLKFARATKEEDAASLWPTVAFYTLVITSALYTHYFAFTIFLVANVAYALWLLLTPSARKWRASLLWSLSQLLVILLYLPWLNFAREQLRTWPAISQPISLGFLAQEVLRIFSLGLFAQIGPSIFGFLAIALLGLIPKKERDEGYSIAFVLTYLLLPPLVMYLLSLSRPLYRPKLLLLATPGYLLLLARGVSGVWMERNRNVVTDILLLFVTLASGFSLHGYFFDPRYARDDYRGLARYITATSKRGDAILLNAPGQIDIFSYYYKGPLSIYPLPGERPLDERKTEQALEEIRAKHPRLFALFWATQESDPARFIEGWLDRRGFKALDLWYGNVRLVLYAIPLATLSEEIQYPREVLLGDRIRFLGYNLLNSEVEAGDILPLTLFWEALGPVEERYKVFIHLLDAQDHIVGQRDAEPGGGAKITTTWREGETIADNHGVLILPGTPPGKYRVEMGMYSLRSGERLPTKEGEAQDNRILLLPIRVLKPKTPPPLEALQMGHQLEIDFGPLRLLGYNLSKLGFDPQAPLYPGDTLHLTLFWRAREKPESEIALTIELTDSRGESVTRRETSPVEGGYPPTAWEQGEIVRDQHYLLIPSSPPGRYRLLLRVRDARGKEIESSPLFLESLNIK
ncbi:MAG: glycosyltransferase family 39 protein [Anaerolineae bacterium]